MGQLPFVFDGDRTKADNFIDEVKGYLLLNQDINGFNSPIKKVAFTLTLIKGPDTTGWTRDICTWLEGLNPAIDNVPAVWDQFLVEFAQQYQDSQRGQCTHLWLENLKMVHPLIDEYIAKFKDATRQAGYTQGNKATNHYFLKGLTPGVLLNVLKPPNVQGYAAIKEQAIESTRSRILIENLLGPRGRGSGSNTSWGLFHSFRGGAFQPFNVLQGPPRPFFSQNYSTPPQTGATNTQNYNSTTAPQWMNNMPVPMDLGHTRVSNWCYNNRGVQGHIAQTNRAPLQCFNCGKEGHFTRNCHQGQWSRANLIDFDDLQSDTTLAPPGDRIVQLSAEIDLISIDKWVKLAQGMGVAEDFPTAWSDRHWLGRIAIEKYTCLQENPWLFDSTLIPLQKELKH